MKRREFLTRGATLGVLAASSGCTAESLREAERKPPLFEGIDVENVDIPVRERTEVAGSAVGRAAAEFRTLEEFEAYLDEQGVHVESLEAGGADAPVVSLESAVEGTGERALMDHLGVVAGGYAALVAGSAGGEALEVSLLDARSEAFGKYEIRRRWAEEYGDGEITAKKYASEIVTTVESA